MIATLLASRITENIPAFKSLIAELMLLRFSHFIGVKTEVW